MIIRTLARLSQIFAVTLACTSVVLAEPITIGYLFIAAGYSLLAATLYGASYLIQRFATPRPKPGDTPRQDIRVTTSREGEGIPRIYGTFAVGAKVIDRGPVTATLLSTSTGSGKRRTTNYQYRYSCSLAAVVCENFNGTILGISRIWYDGVLKYSQDPATLTGTNPAVEGTVGSGIHVQRYGHAEAFQILLGQETQTDRCDFFNNGDDNSVPAYRGYVTLWWQDMDLTPFYNRIPQILVEVVSSQDSFQDIATQECALAGIDSSDVSFVDTSTLNSSIPLGMFADGPTPPKQLFETMDLLSPIGVADVDGGIKFFPLPQSSSVTVTDGELGTLNAGRDETPNEQPVKFAMSTEQPVEIPQRVEMTFYDPTLKYEQATVGYARQYGTSVGTKQYFMPMSDVIETFETAASKLCARFQTERDGIKVSLPPKYIRYHPGSTLTIPAPNAQSIDMRIVNMEFAPGQMVEIEGLRQIRLQGLGPPSAGTDNTVDTGGEDTYIYSVFIISNCPPLIDDHDGFDGVYWAAGPSEVSTSTPPAQWLGATLYRNACGSDDTFKVYEPMASTNATAVIGKARSVLASATGIDSTNTVDVEVPYGAGTTTILGTLDDAFENTTTANLCILGKEVLQFRDVEDVSDSYSYPADSGMVWRLSHLKRGIRDTESQVGTHATNEGFVLWDPAAVIRVPVNINEHLSTFSYKTLSKGQEESEIGNPVFITVDPTVPFMTLTVHTPA